MIQACNPISSPFLYHYVVLDNHLLKTRMLHFIKSSFGCLSSLKSTRAAYVLLLSGEVLIAIQLSGL